VSWYQLLSGCLAYLSTVMTEAVYSETSVNFIRPHFVRSESTGRYSSISASCGCPLVTWNSFKQAPLPESANELYRPSDRRLLAKLVLTFADSGRHVVSVMNPCCRILGFLNKSRYFFFQAAPQFYSRGWVNPVPHPLLLRKSGSAGNRTRTSWSVARNWPLDHRGSRIHWRWNF
jgi:hypothetical protein